MAISRRQYQHAILGSANLVEHVKHTKEQIIGDSGNLDEKVPGNDEGHYRGHHIKRYIEDTIRGHWDTPQASGSDVYVGN